MRIEKSKKAYFDGMTTVTEVQAEPLSNSAKHTEPWPETTKLSK